jgi:hypothetical protein
MTDVVRTNEIWQRAQRGSLVVILNAFTPYNPSVDVGRYRRPQFVVRQEAVAYSITIEQCTQAPAPVVQSSDIFLGNDTYGWPPIEDVWAPSQHSTIVELTPVTPLTPAYDVLRIYKNAYAWSTPETFMRQAPFNGLVITGTSQLALVPNVLAVQVVLAEGLLSSLAFNYSVSFATSLLYNAGQVMAQSPAGGTFAFTGSTVALVVSLGPGPGPYPPPPYVPPPPAPAGFGGDTWGADGGGVVQNPTNPPILQLLSDSALPANGTVGTSGQTSWTQLISIGIQQANQPPNPNAEL